MSLWTLIGNLMLIKISAIFLPSFIGLEGDDVYSLYFSKKKNKSEQQFYK